MQTAKAEPEQKLMRDAHMRNNYEELGIISQQVKPRYPAQAVLDARLRSFANPDHSWPSTAPISAESLAQAGFFYTGTYDHSSVHSFGTSNKLSLRVFVSSGVGDSTRCFHCNGGLTNWVKGDDPWTEHARWFPKCNYVKLNKGDQFIVDSRQKFPPSAAYQVSCFIIFPASLFTAIMKSGEYLLLCTCCYGNLHTSYVWILGTLGSAVLTMAQSLRSFPLDQGLQRHWNAWEVLGIWGRYFQDWNSWKNLGFLSSWESPGIFSRLSTHFKEYFPDKTSLKFPGKDGVLRIWEKVIEKTTQGHCNLELISRPFLIFFLHNIINWQRYPVVPEHKE